MRGGRGSLVALGVVLLALGLPAGAAAAPVAVELSTTAGQRLGRLVGEQQHRVAYFPLGDVMRLAGLTARGGAGRHLTLVGRHGALELTRDSAGLRVGAREVRLAAPVRASGTTWRVPGDFLVRALPALVGAGVRVTSIAIPPPRAGPPAVVASRPPGAVPRATLTRRAGSPAAPPPAVAAKPPPASRAAGTRSSTPPPAPVAPRANGPPAAPPRPAEVAGPASAGTGPPRPAAPAPTPAAPPTADRPGPPPAAPSVARVAPAPEPPAAGGARASAPPEGSGESGTAPPAPTRSSPAATGAPARAAGVELRFRSYPTYTRVVLESAKGLEPRLVESSQGLVVAFPGVSPAGWGGTRMVRDGLVGSLELGESRGAAALVIGFERAPASRRVFRLEEPPRVVLDFYRDPAPPAPPAPGGPAPLRTVVIDPGHGGHDPGATGASGLREKELTLDIARRVAALLQEDAGVRVVLTRTRDQFVPLRERTTMANREGADLFVSIHVNAAPANAATGTETYFLSTEATDGAARRAAEYENRVVALERGPRGGSTDVLRSILWDLAQSDFQQESSRAAETIQTQLDRALRRPSRGVKQAPFYVLGGAAMPAVLVEIGFITNRQEEERLRDDGYRERISRALAAGVATYKQSYDARLGAVTRR